MRTVVPKGQEHRRVHTADMCVCVSVCVCCAQVMMMMVPEAWQNDKLMAQEKKDFYMMASAVVSTRGHSQYMYAANRKAAGQRRARTGTQGQVPAQQRP